MVEGDLWVHARTDLADFYAGRLTLRQIWVRFSGLPPEANIMVELSGLVEKAEAARKVADVDDVLKMIGGPRA